MEKPVLEYLNSHPTSVYLYSDLPFMPWASFFAQLTFARGGHFFSTGAVEDADEDAYQEVAPEVSLEVASEVAPEVAHTCAGMVVFEQRTA